MITGDDHDDAFLTAACRAMEGAGDDDALDLLGWWDLLPDIGHPDAGSAVFAAFRAQGRTLRASPALGGLLAQPYVEGTAMRPGTVVAAVRRTSARRGEVWNVVGDIGDRLLLFDVPAVGVHVVEAADVEQRPVDVRGNVVHEVHVDLTRRAPLLDDQDVAAARARSTQLGRVAAAAEILGASERAVALAVEHAGLREQFDRPIGAFQAVRHLLAWAKTDVTAIDAAVRAALLLLDDLPPRLDAVVKALAGRNGRRACERSLQVLGGIGFTAEHDHHRHHSRVLALDALLGSSFDLTRDLGAWLRSGAAPDYPRSVLLAPTG